MQNVCKGLEQGKRGYIYIYIIGFQVFLRFITTIS